MTDAAPRRLLRKAEVELVHPVSDKTRRLHERAGLFPKRLRIEGTKFAVWDAAEVAAWSQRAVKTAEPGVQPSKREPADAT